MGTSKVRSAFWLAAASGLTVVCCSAGATEQANAGYSVQARVEWGAPSSRAADGSFELRSEVRGAAALVSYGGEYALGSRAGVDLTVAQGCECLCAPDTIFSDGFESGNTAAWSVTVP